MVQNVSIKREFEAGLCYVTTGEISLSNPAVNECLNCPHYTRGKKSQHEMTPVNK